VKGAAPARPRSRKRRNRDSKLKRRQRIVRKRKPVAPSEEWLAAMED